MDLKSSSHPLITCQSPENGPAPWRRPFVAMGVKTISRVNDLGAIALFLAKTFLLIFRPKQVRAIIRQMFHIGASSSIIVLMVGLFTGMVMGLQMYYALVTYGSEAALGSAVALSLVRELGPVLTAVMITARAGSAMTAEIGIQRISEQIDALQTMGINPIKYLISPRLAAAIISFPILTAFFDLIGLVGGYLTGVLLLGLNPGVYLYRVGESLTWGDIHGGFVKAIVFAVLVSTICTYRGFFCHLQPGSRGAQSVSLATTSAVVLSCVWILVADYVVTSFLM
jgi:phospholipid/cholesterol/gamma-HCH transport system permease protein